MEVKTTTYRGDKLWDGRPMPKKEKGKEYFKVAQNSSSPRLLASTVLGVPSWSPKCCLGRSLPAHQVKNLSLDWRGF